MKLKSKHSSHIAGGHEEGAAALEFAFSLMPIIFAIMFFMGMGYVLSNKQHAVVAGRFATTAHVASRSESNYTAPDPAVLSQAVSRGAETYAVNTMNNNIPENVDMSGADGAVLGIVNTVLSSFDPPAQFEATTQPNRGMLPQIYTLQSAKGRYFLPKGTWTCQQWGGSGYLGVLLGQVKFLDGVTGNGCCTTYDNK